MSKFLVVGLGSMGKRRIRCLMALGISNKDIYGLDLREDRCEEAKKKYNINIIKYEKEINFEDIKAVIVSLPPDKHHIGADIALKHNVPVFIEASVVKTDVEKIKGNNKGNVFIAPSCTMLYHPMILKIKKIVESKEYGRVCNFSYHSGQYLPDWHPWEDVNDFYVSNRITGGAREIVPFELTWIIDMFGFPNDIKGYFRKTTNVGCDIEDSYACTIDYGDMIGNLLVDVVGRNAARNLIINFEKAQLQWRWDMDKIEIFEAENNQWIYIKQDEQLHEDGYNANIGENMYIDEISAFLKGIENQSEYPNSIEKDLEILSLLEKVENSDGGFNRN